MTFTNKAAREIVARAGSKLAKANSERQNGGRTRLPWAGTYHSIGFQLVRRYARRLGLNEKLNVLDQEDAKGLMEITRHDCELAGR